MTHTHTHTHTHTCHRNWIDICRNGQLSITIDVVCLSVHRSLFIVALIDPLMPRRNEGGIYSHSSPRPNEMLQKYLSFPKQKNKVDKILILILKWDPKKLVVTSCSVCFSKTFKVAAPLLGFVGFIGRLMMVLCRRQFANEEKREKESKARLQQSTSEASLWRWLSSVSHTASEQYIPVQFFFSNPVIL